MNILSLPADILSVIFNLISLPDVINLSQVNSTFHQSIITDKQLWVHILKRDVSSADLSIPSNLVSIESASASDIYTWVKHAFILNNNLNTPCFELSISDFNTKRKVTWVKLIRGTWCLTASSDTQSTSLQLWRISHPIPAGDSNLVAEYSLPAPVIDGILDDCGDHIRCAITIGTSPPYISITEISQEDGGPTIGQVACIPEASHVQLFNDSVVGFAARNGDDTYPYVAVWSTGKVYRLFSPSLNAISPLPLDPSLSMIYWDGFVLSHQYRDIKLYALPKGDGDDNDDSDDECDAKLLASLALPEFHDNISTTLLHLYRLDALSVMISTIKQNEESDIGFSTIICNPYSDIGEKIISSEISWTGPRSSEDEASPIMRYCIGSTGKKWIHMFLPCKSRLLMPKFFTSSVPQFKRDSGDTCRMLSRSSENVQFSRKGLPLPFLISAMDFDDGWGLLAVAGGSNSGVLSIGSFIKDPIVAESSVDTSLPLSKVKNREALNISEPIPNEDIPLFYAIKDEYPDSYSIPLEIVSEYSHYWKQVSQIQPIPGWSNDWLRNEYGSLWIRPYPYYGTESRNLDYIEKMVSNLQLRLGSFGEILPIMYNEDNHTKVLFRVGNRVFVYQWFYSAEEEADGLDDYAYILGVLPYTYEEITLDTSLISTSIANRDVILNLTENLNRGIVEILQGRAANLFLRVRRNYLTENGEDIGDPSLGFLEWSDEDWNIVLRSYF